MLRPVIKLLVVSLLTYLLSGCANHTNNALDGLNEMEYKIVQERLDFEKNQNADMQFEINAYTNVATQMLLDAHVKIMYKINLKQDEPIKSVIHTTLSANNQMHFEKLLIEKKDYFFDSVNQALFLAIEIPYIYLLDNSTTLHLDIAMMNKKRQLRHRSIDITYETRAMQENSEDYMSFKFEKSFDSPNVDNYILKMIKNELRQAYLPAFDDAYKQRHSKLFELED